MAYRYAWASIAENGTVDKTGKSKPGDQTGKEVKLGNYYDFGQSAVYRFKDRELAEKYAACFEYLCTIEPDGDMDGDMDGVVGYSQGMRGTLYKELKALDFDYKKLRKRCCTDCSALTAAALNCVGVKVYHNLYTGSLDKYLMETGLFTKLTDRKYIDTGDYHKVGDIINNPNRHVITCLKNGPKASTTSRNTTYKVGNIYTLQQNMNVRTGPGTSQARKKRALLTADGRKNSLNKTYGVLKAGTKVTCLEVEKKESSTWIRIPSGWICAKGKTVTYVK